MDTTIYFIRHSEYLKLKKMKYDDTDQIHNEKQPLSVNGERRARLLSELDELYHINMVISSHYVRTISTAKYIAERNDLEVYINEDFRERKHGVNWDQIPEDFEKRQFYEEDYKLGDGENQKEVRERMYQALLNVLDLFKGERVVIASHATAMTYLFMKWCEIERNEENWDIKMSFKGNTFFERPFSAPETFKLVFNENKELISIENIAVEYHE